MVGKAVFHVTEEMTEEFMHERVRGFRQRNKSRQWDHDMFVGKAHHQFQSILVAADSRKLLREQAAEAREQQDTSEDIADTLDMIVARDPERYLAWLSTMGYFYFTMNAHNPYAFSWEDWCTWIAPTSFEKCCKPGPAGARSLLGFNRSRYGPASNRPTITLDQAKKGNRRAMEFKNTASGLEVSLKEKPQYSFIGGEATSREAAAHYHAIRGKDVWLFEPGDPEIEVYEDPSRLREAEVEASFRRMS